MEKTVGAKLPMKKLGLPMKQNGVPMKTKLRVPMLNESYYNLTVTSFQKTGGARHPLGPMDASHATPIITD